MMADYEVHNITGLESGFEYISLPKHFSEDALKRYAERQNGKLLRLLRTGQKKSKSNGYFEIIYH